MKMSLGRERERERKIVIYEPESLSVLGADDIVEQRVEGGGEEVQAPRDVEQVLVHRTEGG